MQSIAQKAFLGAGVQACTPRRSCARKVNVVKAAAAPVSTALNTKRSEEVGLAILFRCRLAPCNFIRDDAASHTGHSKGFAVLPKFFSDDTDCLKIAIVPYWPDTPLYASL
jgi:hypothetical protein